MGDAAVCAFFQFYKGGPRGLKMVGNALVLTFSSSLNRPEKLDISLMGNLNF